MDKKFNITVRCLFCQASLQVDEGVKYSSGDMIKCHSCGELNDYDSVVNVAKEEGIKKLKSEFEAEMKKSLKKFFK